jgi:TetR/AcrR family transcriptional regulator, cholesterol catabolism regulator
MERSEILKVRDSLDVAERPPRERRNRDAEMMRAALELFARKGYAAASIQDVADAIGVLKGSVYHYIGSKEDLLFRIFHEAHVENEALMMEIAALDAAPRAKLRIYLERTLLTTLNNIERTTLYFRDWRHLTGDRRETLASHRARYDLFLRQLIEAVYAAEGITQHLNLKHISSFVIGGTNWVADWFRPGGADSAESIAADYASLAMSAILGSGTAPKPAAFI